MSERILLVRRDNIGDLVLTTPLIAALRAKKPDAWIGFLANSYNAPVLSGNPHLDAVFAYDKAKHRPDKSRWSVYAGTLHLLLRLRRLHIDTVVLAGPGPQRQALRLARWVGARDIAGFVGAGFAPRAITRPVDYGEGAKLHETADVFRLLEPFGMVGEIPPCQVSPDPAVLGRLRAAVSQQIGTGRPLVGIQISARRPRQRWPMEKFADLMARIGRVHDTAFMLFWAPGAAGDVHHPGDDEQAAALLKLLPRGMRIFAHATESLEELIVGLSLVDGLITPDGGAMHLAAGLGKPIVALFGDSPAARWHPWGVPYEAVQADARDVVAIPVDAVLSAWERLAPTVMAGLPSSRQS